MRHIWLVLAVVCCLAGLTLASEPVEEKPLTSKVVSVALFKNGLAVIKRQVTLDGAGTFNIKDVPDPIHGTFWVESKNPIEARVETRETRADASAPLGVHLQDELAGLKVTIQGRQGKTPITGSVMKMPPPETLDISPYESARYPQPTSRFLILKTDKGVSYVDMNDIASMEIDGQPTPRSVKKPVLLLATGPRAPAGPVQISYLAHGLSWAPSYKVDLTDPKKLIIEQHAVIRNELADLNETEIQLISGYPSVQFGHVTSPLVASQSWANFFNQLNQRGVGQVFDNSMSQSISYNMRQPGGAAAPMIAPNAGDNIDLNYHSIGKRNLKKGTAMALSTGQADASYERIVDWTIPDNRNEWGSPNPNARRTDPTTGEPLQDDVWDALKFKNPLPFPMTTAPAMVTSNGRFNGQRQVHWTNRNEEAVLRVNKALSIRARHVEYEDQQGGKGVAERDIIYLGGRRFRKPTVNGELRLCNHRGADVKMIIKRQFSGDLIKAEGEPKIDLREEGVWTVNKRNELTWTLILKPNEERTIPYQYTLLVDF